MTTVNEMKQALVAQMATGPYRSSPGYLQNFARHAFPDADEASIEQAVRFATPERAEIYFSKQG